MARLGSGRRPGEGLCRRIVNHARGHRDRSNGHRVAGGRVGLHVIGIKLVDRGGGGRRGQDDESDRQTRACRSRAGDRTGRNIVLRGRGKVIIARRIGTDGKIGIERRFGCRLLDGERVAAGGELGRAVRGQRGSRGSRGDRCRGDGRAAAVHVERNRVARDRPRDIERERRGRARYCCRPCSR